MSSKDCRCESSVSIRRTRGRDGTLRGSPGRVLPAETPGQGEQGKGMEASEGTLRSPGFTDALAMPAGERLGKLGF